jgi:hypothetical protein
MTVRLIFNNKVMPRYGGRDKMIQAEKRCLCRSFAHGGNKNQVFLQKGFNKKPWYTIATGQLLLASSTNRKVVSLRCCLFIAGDVLYDGFELD